MGKCIQEKDQYGLDKHKIMNRGDAEILGALRK